MAGISSKALAFGDPRNKDKTFQSQKVDDDLGLNWIQFKWRNHDLQIGRFIEVDPLSDKYVYNSTYAFSENKVTNNVELEGLESAPVGNPMSYVLEGFRQMFQAAGSFFSFKAEVHINKEVEVKAEVKTPVGTLENKTTTTVAETKFEIKSNFGNYFKYGGGNLVEFNAETTAMEKVENTTTGTINTKGPPVKLSTKTTIDENGTSQTASVGTGATIKVNDKTNVNINASGFVTQQQTGSNAGQTTVGVKASFESVFMQHQRTLINAAGVKVTTSTQTNVGGSIIQTYKFPF